MHFKAYSHGSPKAITLTLFSLGLEPDVGGVPPAWFAIRWNLGNDVFTIEVLSYVTLLIVGLLQ